MVLPRGMGAATAPVSELVRLPWVWTRHDCPFHRAFIDRLGLTPRSVTADAVDEHMVEKLVRAGTGAALMRQDQAGELEEQGIVRIWQGPALEIPLCAACLDSRKNETRISCFLASLDGMNESVNMS